MPPTKLAHVVYQTNRMPEMREWYATVLGGHVVYENPHLCFVTYDDEHHRVAFVDFGPLSPRAGAEVELAGGLVGEQDRRIVGERTRNRDALLFPARELGRIVMPAIG